LWSRTTKHSSNSSTDQGGGKRRGSFIRVKPIKEASDGRPPRLPCRSYKTLDPALWSQRRTAAPFEPIPTETVVKRLSVLRPRCAAAKVLPRRNSQPERRKRHVRKGDCQSKNPPQAAMTNNDSAKASAMLPIKAMEGKASRTACSSQWRLIPYLVSRYGNLIKIKRPTPWLARRAQVRYAITRRGWLLYCHKTEIQTTQPRHSM
jgi:hypothetical protein